MSLNHGLEMTEGRHCQVHLLDDRRLELLVQPKLLSRELLDLVASHFNLKEKEYFGITFIDDTGQENWLQLDHRVLEHDLPKKPGPTLLHFAVRFYIESISFLKDKNTVELFFLNAKACVHKGQIEVDSETIFKLAALVLQESKGDYTRKPRINSQLVAQQVAQQYATPPPPKKEKKEKVEKPDKEKPEKDKDISPSVTKKNTNKKTKPKSDILKDPPSEANSIQSANATTKTSETNHSSRPRLKNVDRSTAQQLAVTVGNVTVIITDFKEKTRSSSTSSSTVTSSAGSEQQNQSSSGSESTDKGSSRSSTPKGDMSAVNDESF